jgi:hypothetical protein
MAFNGTGTFLRIYNWVTDKVNGVPITASRFDAELDGMATGLSNCITKDGQTLITANIPLNSNKLTGVGNGTARTDTINVGQVQDNQFQYLGTTGGGADAYTLAPSPPITAYAATQKFTAKISATNLTTTPYLQISSIASPATTAVIKKLSATKTEIAVEVSDLLINGIYDFKRNSANDAWIVLNPEKAFYNLTNLTKATSTTQGISFLPNPITISNNATDADNDIDFSAGNFKFSDKSNEVVLLAMTKRLDALWTAGTNNGGLDTGSKANSTWYHCYAIHNPTSDVSDAIFSVNATTPTLPSGYTKYKYLGSVLTNVSGNIVPFIQKENYFEWKSAVNDYTGNLTTTEVPIPLSVPLGFISLADLNYSCAAVAVTSNKIFLRNPALTTRINTQVGFFGFSGVLYDFGGECQVLTNNLSQILISTTNASNATLVGFVINNCGYYNLSL